MDLANLHRRWWRQLKAAVLEDLSNHGPRPGFYSSGLMLRKGNACVWVQAPSAEVAVKFVTERAGPMGGWRTGPGVEQEVLPRAKYSEHAIPPDARSMWSRHEGRPAA